MPIEEVLRMQAISGARLEGCYDATVTGIRLGPSGGWLVDMEGTIMGSPCRLQAYLRTPATDPDAISCERCIVL